MLIRSDDSGAPALNGENGSLYDVLKWALPQLGWTIEFDNGSDVIVFRNSGAAGTGNYLRLDDNPVNHDAVDARLANVRSFSQMTDIDSGSDEVGGADWLLPKSASATADARPWAIVGDETYFWFLVDPGTGGFFTPYYIGDIAPDNSGDTGAFLTQATNATDPSSASTIIAVGSWGGTSIDGYSALRYNYSITSVSENAVYTAENYSGGTGVVSSRAGASGPYPEPGVGGIRVVDTTVQEQSSGVIRGRLKGAMRPMNDILGQFTNFETISSQATARGLRDCLAINISSRLTLYSNLGVLLFDPDFSGGW